VTRGPTNPKPEEKRIDSNGQDQKISSAIPKGEKGELAGCLPYVRQV